MELIYWFYVCGYAKIYLCTYFSKVLAGNEEDGLTENVWCSLGRNVDDEEYIIIGSINC